MHEETGTLSMGGLLLGFFLLVFVLALGIVRLFRLPIQWIGYVALGLLVVGVYWNSILEAKENSWTLWRRNWMQDVGEVEQLKLAKYITQDDCLKEQWKKLNEALEQKRQFRENFKLPGSRTVYLVEGHTVFQFGPSLYSRMPDLQSRLLSELTEQNKKELTPHQKERITEEMLMPEIVSSVSFFCAPSVKYNFWPYYTPPYHADDDLRSLGEKTLADRAKKMLGE